MNKKFFLGLLLLGLLVGCDNPTEINDGVPPPVIVNGSVGGATFNGEGLAAFAKVQFIGIDQYGQPQRNSEGEYLGQVYHTNENGVLENAQISGSYLGPLLVVASYDKYSETVIDGESIERETALTCPLPNGCVNENNEAVAFGDSFAPPASFKLMAVVHEVTDPLTINVSPLTHLAAKLAFGDFISDGTSCDNSTCLADIFSKGLINAEKIYEANSRLQKQALINTGFPVNIAPWQSESITDTVIQQDAAKHGLLSNVFFQDMVTRGESTQQVLDWWVDSYLVNKGQLIEDDQANAIKQLDFRHLFETAVAIEQQFADVAEGSLSDSALQLAATTYGNSLSSLDADVVTTFSGDSLPLGEGEESIEAKITAAKTLVGNVQTWLLDLDNQDYVSFFSQEIHDDIENMEGKWDAYNAKLSPVLQELFLPLVQFAEYNLSCVRAAGNVCDATNVLHNQDIDGEGGADLVYDTANESFVYRVNESTGLFPKIVLQGQFETVVGESANFKRFKFTGSNSVETADGKVLLESEDLVEPQLSLTMRTELAVDQVPDIRRIEMALPKITVTAKENDGSNVGVYYLIEEMGVALQGTTDPTRPDEPVHFNIEGMDFKGSIVEGTGDAQEKLVTTVNLNSSNAGVYYAKERFPNLDVRLDSDALKGFASFGGVDVSNSDFAGWLELPSDLSYDGEGNVNDELVGVVQYVEEDEYSNIESGLQDILQLNNAASFTYGALEYPGGITALIIWKENVEDEADRARQCLKVSGVWACFTELAVENLGCENDYGVITSSMSDAYTYLQTEGCIAQVNIDGRGTYDIQYPDSTFVSGEAPYDIELNKPHRLGLSSFNIRTIGFFKEVDENNSSNLVDSPRALFDITGAAADLDAITLGVSLTHNYLGFAEDGNLAFFNFIPYGDRTLWLAMGTDTAETDALVYYILQDNITLTMTAFDYTNEDPGSVDSIDRNPDHDEPLGYIRYDGTLLGTLRQEGSLYVVRYIDGSWQVL